MKRFALLLMAAGLMASGGAYAVDDATIAKNKEVAIGFYNSWIQGNVAGLYQFARPDYIQHNPNFETGLQGLEKAIKGRAPRPANAPPIQPLKFVRVIADGEYVVMVRRVPVRGAPADTEPTPQAERALLDIFRIQDGKVAEHWDYSEEFPRGKEPPKNNNGRF